MKGPDQYEMDEGLMDELGGAMDDFDDKKMRPSKPVVIEITIHPHGKDDETSPTDELDEDPTPEELDELMKATS